MFSNCTTEWGQFNFTCVKCWPAEDNGDKLKQSYKLKDEAGYERKVTNWNIAGPDLTLTPAQIEGKTLLWAVRKSVKLNPKNNQPYYNGYLAEKIPANGQSFTQTAEQKDIQKEYEHKERIKAEGMTRTHICGAALAGGQYSIDELSKLTKDATKIHLLDDIVSYCMDGFPVPDPSIQEGNDDEEPLPF